MKSIPIWITGISVNGGVPTTILVSVSVVYPLVPAHQSLCLADYQTIRKKEMIGISPVRKREEPKDGNVLPILPGLLLSFYVSL